MKTTAAVLKALQDYYASLPNRPGIKEIARISSMPVATTGRYLNGTTQSGDIERVRALCIALDRHDLLDELPSTTVINTFQEALALIIEIKKESRESNLEELERVRKSHEDAEMRWGTVIASKDKSIEMLSHRIEKLEKDKENQAFVNKEILAEKEEILIQKAEIEKEMKYFRNSKRKYEAILIVVLVLAIIYICAFDLPNPSNGITQLLAKIFG